MIDSREGDLRIGLFWGTILSLPLWISFLVGLNFLLIYKGCSFLGRSDIV
jgi:hypothetical protein